MQAVLYKEWGKPDDLNIENVPRPVPTAGEVRIGIHAFGLNFADTVLIARFYQMRPPLPFSPGFEGAGEVLKVGEGVEGFKPGDRVAVFCDYGGFAEEGADDVSSVFRIPNQMDDITAASFFNRRLP